MDLALTSASPPWIYVFPEGDVLLQAARRDIEESGGIWKSLDGASMASSEARLFKEMASALSFPSYFGSNWDALEECLGDIYRWQKSSVVVIAIENCDDMLNASYLPLLTTVLRRSCEWAGATLDEDGDSLGRPGVALHFAFSLTSGNVKEMAVRMRRSGLRVELQDGQAFVM